jgi:Ca-activated chloride channel family protein
MLVLDVSPSMGEEFSLGRSRLAAAREETLRFLEKRPGDAIGLVAFGREAFVRAPPSLARDGLRSALHAVEPGGLGEGTALGTALGLAADRLRAVDAASRVIVLLTDGESNAGALDPSTAARAAGALGQRLHVVDVSTRDEARATLADVARVGGGLHLIAGDPSAMDRAYREIDALERAPIPGLGEAASVPVAGPLLWMALLLVVAEQALRGSRWGTLP